MSGDDLSLLSSSIILTVSAESEVPKPRTDSGFARVVASWIACCFSFARWQRTEHTSAEMKQPPHWAMMIDLPNKIITTSF